MFGEKALTVPFSDPFNVAKSENDLISVATIFKSPQYLHIYSQITRNEFSVIHTLTAGNYSSYYCTAVSTVMIETE